VQELRARLPFRYGIVTMTHLPHVFVRVTLEVDGKVRHGFSAEHLPPKWFTKNPASSYADDLKEMVAVVRHAAKTIVEIPAQETPFGLWHELYVAQRAWASANGVPPLLGGLGAALMERAMIDAFCRVTGQTFAEATVRNTLGFAAGVLHGDVEALEPADFLPPEPLRSIIVRHTVGLTDPLTEEDIVDGERVQDGLPQSLESFIREHGLTHFKIKLGGDVEKDVARLRRLAEVLPSEAKFTLDGNENYHAVEPFRALWGELCGDPVISRLMGGLIFVEQPFHRDIALSAATGEALRAWKDRPEMIIDESDAELESLPAALAGGYLGTSHKNCKGIFKSLANAAYLAHYRQEHPELPLHLSAEDLSNVGPVALPQDLAVVAVLAIPHAERNGHHYFAGLSQFSAALQNAAWSAHRDLYEDHAEGFPMLRIRAGRMEIGSVVDAPLGVDFEPDLTGCTPLEAWSPASLEMSKG
jgi:hypothetical protein